MPPKNEIVIRDATNADVETLATTVPRAYSPEDFMTQIFKDGPTMREWWADVYTCAIQDPTYRILVVLDGSAVVGVLTLALWRKTAALPEAAGGLCTLVPLTDDHDEVLKEALVEQITHRRDIMGEQTNFIVDLLCVDIAYQSQGIGGRLMKLGCEVADKEKAAIFLVTGSARKYYLKLRLDFEEVEQVTEHDADSVIIRQAKKS